jgi:hypothetical protein
MLHHNPERRSQAMNFMHEIESRRSGRIVRVADGGIDFDHYRTKAQRERAAALADFGARLAARLRPAKRLARSIETPWMPAATPRRP